MDQAALVHPFRIARQPSAHTALKSNVNEIEQGDRPGERHRPDRDRVLVVLVRGPQRDEADRLRV